MINTIQKQNCTLLSVVRQFRVIAAGGRMQAHNKKATRRNERLTQCGAGWLL